MKKMITIALLMFSFTAIAHDWSDPPVPATYEFNIPKIYGGWCWPGLFLMSCSTDALKVRAERVLRAAYCIGDTCAPTVNDKYFEVHYGGYDVFNKYQKEYHLLFIAIPNWPNQGDTHFQFIYHHHQSHCPMHYYPKNNGY